MRKSCSRSDERSRVNHLKKRRYDVLREVLGLNMVEIEKA